MPVDPCYDTLSYRVEAVLPNRPGVPEIWDLGGVGKRASVCLIVREDVAEQQRVCVCVGGGMQGAEESRGREALFKSLP